MTTTYLSAEFVERHVTTVAAGALPDSWEVGSRGPHYQLDLKMCQLTAVHFDFTWGQSRSQSPGAGSKLDWPDRVVRVDISLNDLSFLHRDWLSPFLNLRSLDASLNQIKHLDGLEELPELRILTLSHNAIRSLEGVGSCPRLLELRAAVNDLPQISDLPSLIYLRVLDVSNNKLVSLDGLTSLPKLEELYAHRNALKDILPVMSCRRLRVLNAANNKISSFDTTLKVLSGLQALQVLSLHGNPIDREPGYQGEILRLGTSLTTLDNVTVKPLPRREEDFDRHAGNMISLKDAAIQAFHERMRVSRERLDENVSFLQRRIIALQDEQKDFEVKLKGDLDACLRYLENLSDEELRNRDRSNIGAVLRHQPSHPHPSMDGEGDKKGGRARGPPADYSSVKETDELLRCAYNELIKQRSSGDAL